ncbi:MAG: epoxyqueuosine reductase QueH [Candidatus Komeilibacteria bacterium]
MKKMLLHTCCAPCAIYVVQELSKQYDLTLYYYNTNIHPADEYQKRLNEIIKWSTKKNIKLVEAKYNVEDWFAAVKGLEQEPEGALRCFVCYEMRMRETALYAKDNNFDLFGTTMSISPHKKADKLNEIGNKLKEELGIDYLEADWKKNEGFKIACKLSKEENFYRQDYCGCTFSKKNKTDAIR